MLSSTLRSTPGPPVAPTNRQSGGGSGHGCSPLMHLMAGPPPPSREYLQGHPLLRDNIRVGAVSTDRSRPQPERHPPLARPGRAQRSHGRQEPELPPRVAGLFPGPSPGLEGKGAHVPASPGPGGRWVSDSGNDTAPRHLHPQAARPPALAPTRGARAPALLPSTLVGFCLSLPLPLPRGCSPDPSVSPASPQITLRVPTHCPPDVEVTFLKHRSNCHLS